ncbi:hypothetical protein KIN20_023194 [Parelaphostrongylus tenuis]|uniref:Uncharacterized protein n=1 Tax=Parelaphostrongylus tenuis TaxID=148309 RepID=A0AAD5MRM9_PARTN|nr:hypothetical protein KIN20_023194 [Parelaphostrongylus tenuis]
MEEVRSTDSDSSPLASSSSAQQLLSASMSVKPVFQKLDVGKLGKPYPRLETKSSVKKSRKKKKRIGRAMRKTFSHLDLSKRCATASRKVKKTAEPSTVLSSSMTDATDNSEMANKEKITGIDGLDTVKKAKLSLNVERKISDVHGARAASTKSAVSPVIGRSTPSLLSSGQSTKLGNHTSVSMVTATSAPRSLSRKCCSELLKPRRPLHRQCCNKCDVSLSSASPSIKTITMKANIRSYRQHSRSSSNGKICIKGEDSYSGGSSSILLWLPKWYIQFPEWEKNKDLFNNSIVIKFMNATWVRVNKR